MGYQNLRVYQQAQALFPIIYKLVRKWPEKDQRELGSQIIRAANSVHSNIAEGYGRNSAKEFKRYLGNSLASCDEIISHLTDAKNVELLQQDQFDNLFSEYTAVGKQLFRLRENWKR